MLNQEFGKPNLNQSFTAAACFRHILLPLFHLNFLKSGHYSNLSSNLRTASSEAATLTELLAEYQGFDFRLLQGFSEGWEDETEINHDRV